MSHPEQQGEPLGTYRKSTPFNYLLVKRVRFSVNFKLTILVGLIYILKSPF